MSLKLSKTNTPAYDYYSEGDGTDPATQAVTLDGSGGTVTSSAITAYLIATLLAYSSISVTPVSEEAGINWQVSLDNINWAETVSPANMNATAADQVTTIYLRYVATNDGTVTPGYKTAANVRVSGLAAP